MSTTPEQIPEPVIQESQEPPILTNNPQEDRTKTEIEELKNYRVLLEQQLRNQHREIEELKKKQTQPQVTREEDPTELFKNPRKMIKEEVAEAVAPLVDFVRMFAQKTEVDTYIDRAKQSSLGHKVSPAVEQQLRHIFSQPNATLNEDNFQAAIYATIGMEAAGIIGGGSPSVPNSGAPAPTKDEGNKVTVPPHIKPSVPAPEPPRKQIRTPTELEKRIMAQNGFKSVEEYDMWLNMPATDVAAHKEAAK